MSEATGTPTSTVAVATPTTVAPGPLWTSLITAFAGTIGKKPEEVTSALLPLVGDPTDEMAAALGNPDVVDDPTIKGAFSGVPIVKINLAISNLRAAAAPKAPVAVEIPEEAPLSRTSQYELLAPVPPSESFLTGLSLMQVGKVGRDEVINGIKVAIADRSGLFRASKFLLEMMDEFVTRRMEEAAPPEYYALEDEIAKQDNAEVLRLLKVSGRYVSAERKKEFLERIVGLWKPAFEFQQQLRAWVESYNTVVANPANLMQAVGALAAGRGARVTSMRLPDTAMLHDGAQLVIRAINMAYAGRVTPAAAALAFDAERINGFLTNPNVVRYTGCTNREELARVLSHKLGNTLVTSDYRRLENNLTQFILSVYEFDSRAPMGSPQEADYILALYDLGQGISWEKLFGEKRSSDSDDNNGNGRINGAGRGAPIPGGTERVRSRGLPLADERG